MMDIIQLYADFSSKINAIEEYNRKNKQSFSTNNIKENEYDRTIQMIIRKEEFAGVEDFENRIKTADINLALDIYERLKSDVETRNLFDEIFTYYYKRLRFDKVLPMHREMIYIYLYTLLDAYLLDIIRFLYASDTRRLISEKKTMTYKEVIEAITDDSLIDSLIEKEIVFLGHESIFDRLVLLMDSGISIESKTIVFFVEYNKRRNMLVHNNGMVNDKFFSCSSDAQKKYHKYMTIYNDTLNELKKNNFIDMKLDINQQDIEGLLDNLKKASKEIVLEINRIHQIIS